MNSEERDMIAGLFDRMRDMGAIDKDRDADAFIQRAVRQTPDAAYMLVQSVLVQEHALQQADARIQELEARVAELEEQLQPPRQSSGGGGFLGGIFGNRQAPQSAPMGRASYGSVPPVGGRSTPSYEPEPAQRGPWAGAPSQQGRFGQPSQQQPAPTQQGGGGGFLKGAMATAAGVAGGMILADSIRGMLGGSSASAGSHGSHDSGADNSSSWGNSGAADDNDPGGSYHQAADDNDPGGSWDSGGSDDLEI